MSNEVGRVKSGSAAFLLFLQTPLPKRSNRFCSEHWARVSVLFCAPTTCSIRFASSLGCGPPNMSAVTYDHDDFFELPPKLKGGG